VIKCYLPTYLSFFNSSATTGTGTVIYISQNLQLINNQTISASRSPFVTQQPQHGEPISIFNVHMSHKKQESEMMVAARKSIIQSLTSHNIVVAGDWNYVDDLTLDKLNSSHDRKHL
jgi:hypothetical protein